jgi:hypothetical protein
MPNPAHPARRSIVHNMVTNIILRMKHLSRIV